MKVVPNREVNALAQEFIALGYRVVECAKHVQLVSPQGDYITLHRGSHSPGWSAMRCMRSRLRKAQRQVPAMAGGPL